MSSVLNINISNPNTLNLDFSELQFLATINAEITVLAQKDKRLLDILNHSITTIDSQWIKWYYDFKYKTISTKISGSSYIFELIELAKKSNKVILFLGGTIDSNEKAVKNAKHIFDYHNIYGFSPKFEPYPFSKKTNEEILNIIKKGKPDLIITAFGVPKQEFWSSDNIEFLKNEGVQLVCFFGGTISFLAGTEKKAPAFISKLGLESIFRLILNPSRFKRWLRQFYFFYYVLKNSDWREK